MSRIALHDERVARPWGRQERQKAASVLLRAALLEIRALAVLPDQDEATRLAKIHELADVCHNLPGAWSHPRSRDGFDGFVWAWQTANPEHKRWLRRHLEQAGLDWRYLDQASPLPPPPTPPATHPSFRKGGWQLPRTPSAFRSVDTAALVTMLRAAAPDQEPYGKWLEWLTAHLHPNARHILRPHTPSEPMFIPPEPDGPIQHRALLRMNDDALVVGHLPLHQDAIMSRPAHLNWVRRCLLAATPRHRRERDTYLWARDHRNANPDCRECLRHPIPDRRATPGS